MKRQWHIWMLFAMLVAVGLAAMAWVSLRAMRLEQNEAAAIADAAHQERIRLALWRMDSAMLPLVVEESSRPYFHYRPLHAAGLAYNGMFVESQIPDSVPSPLAMFKSTYIRLHFQFDPDGKLVSPQVQPENAKAAGGEFRSTTEPTALALLEQFGRAVKPDALLAQLPPAEHVMAQGPPPASAPTYRVASVSGSNNFVNSNTMLIGNQIGNQDGQFQLNNGEWNRRSANMQIAANPPALRASGYGGESVSEGTLKACWVGDNLVLAHRAVVGSRTYVQGCWLNWEEIRGRLLSEAADLLPAAALEPCSREDEAFRLAVLPVKLVPGPAVSETANSLRPVNLALALGWGCLLAAVLATAIVLRRAIQLSERRGAFVSAVTHEMRTPLTTFQLYSDLLASGMVSDEAKRKDYLRLLQEEAHRLGHLVENVLAYARLAGVRRPADPQAVELGDLIEHTRQRLAERAARAGMSLEVSCAADAAQATVLASAVAVEQVLLNLVDNSCKYAASAADKRIHLEAAVEDGSVILTVRDHGPGVDARKAKRLFQPFSKSAHEAAVSAPGVGLGLAISRRLARDMRGDLALKDGNGDGACFDLKLRRRQ